MKLWIGIGLILAQAFGEQDLVLHSAAAIPVSCNASPVYGNAGYPWRAPFINAEPRFGGFAMVLENSDRGKDGKSYTPLQMHGSLISWLRRTPQSANVTAMTISARSLGGASFLRVFHAGVQSIEFPAPGCWNLQLQATGFVVRMSVWVTKD
ncbi:MAG TPA: hypothetical protein VGR69_04015 [Candidatus Rubrimentiphilum sp.]|nr:hypothetical protein [Candidatus Rubrimentiphilum sp.]